MKKMVGILVLVGFLVEQWGRALPRVREGEGLTVVVEVGQLAPCWRLVWLAVAYPCAV